jgi:hypothetical protein
VFHKNVLPQEIPWCLSGSPFLRVTGRGMFVLLLAELSVRPEPHSTCLLHREDWPRWAARKWKSVEDRVAWWLPGAGVVR